MLSENPKSNFLLLLLQLERGAYFPRKIKFCLRARASSPKKVGYTHEEEHPHPKIELLSYAALRYLMGSISTFKKTAL